MKILLKMNSALSKETILQLEKELSEKIGVAVIILPFGTESITIIE